MSTAYWIAIIIAVLAIIIIAAVGVIIIKRIKPTLNNVENMQSKIQDEVALYQRQTEVIQQKVDQVTIRVDNIQTDTTGKTVVFDELKQKLNELQNSLNILKENGGDYTQKIAKNTFEELKVEGPIIAETFKRAFKRTYQKQKERFDQ